MTVVDVTQEAVEAAATVFDRLAGCTIPRNFGARVRAGEVSELVQAFDILARHRLTRPAQDGEAVAWIVGNGDGTMWRNWYNGMPGWTNARELATRFARREDAEAVHAEDEDAWCVEPFTHPPRNDAVVEALRALDKILPIRVEEGPDYAEVYFSDGSSHSTQAMTMNPQDWRDIAKALDALKQGEA